MTQLFPDGSQTIPARDPDYENLCKSVLALEHKIESLELKTEATDKQAQTISMRLDDLYIQHLRGQEAAQQQQVLHLEDQTKGELQLVNQMDILKLFVKTEIESALQAKSEKNEGSRDFQVPASNGSSSDEFKNITHQWSPSATSELPMAIERLEQRFMKLEATLADFQPSTPHAEVSRDSDVGTHKSSSATKEDVQDAVLNDAQIGVLDETVWESALLIGLPQFGLVVSVMLFYSLALNIILQTLLSVIIARSFPIYPADSKNMARWRRDIGHDISHVDVHGHSLTAQVCAMHSSVSNAYAQIAQLRAAHQYLDLYDGPVLCVVIIILWFLAVSKEAERTFVILKDMYHVPNSSSTCIGCSSDGIWYLEYLHTGRKLFMCGVCIARVAVAGILLVSGTIWLTYTVSVTELVLNGVALAFIFDIDELLFQMFVPKVAKAMLVRLDIHGYAPRRSSNRTLRFGTAKLLKIISLVAFTSIIIVLVLAPNVQTVEKIIHVACNGNIDFVAGEHGDLGMTFYAPSVSMSDEFKSAEAYSDTVLKMILGVPTSDARGLPTIAIMQSMMSQTASELGDTVMPACQDSVPSDLAEYWQRLRQDLGLHTGASCKTSKVIRACGNPDSNLARMLCPETCRCFRAMPSTAISKGCPFFKCQDNVGTAGYYQERLSCNDATAASLLTDKHWRSFWQSLFILKTGRVRKLRGQQNDSEKTGTSNFEEVFDFAMTSGCSVITKYQLHTELCADFSERHSLGTFCPQTCECDDNDYWGCPRHCLVDQE